MMIKLSDRQASRWTVIASYHYQKWKDNTERVKAAPSAKERNALMHSAQWHRDACEFLRQIELQARMAGQADASAVCPICNGKGVI